MSALCLSFRFRRFRVHHHGQHASRHHRVPQCGLNAPLTQKRHPIEQEKQLKYASLVANAIMLSNVADMTDALAAMAEDGKPVTPELVTCLSPYTREHIRRFGRYVLDMDDLPNPLNPQPLPFEPTL